MIYLDNAATSKYKPPAVVRAVVEELQNSANPGRGAHSDSIRSGLKILAARDTVRLLIRDKSARVVFTKNCTEAVNLAVFGTFKENARVVTTVNEHNSVLRPLYELERMGRIKLTVVAPKLGGAVSPSDIERALGPDVCLVCVNHISNVTGAKADIEAIGRLVKRCGALFLVDAAQSAGHTDIDMKKFGIDLLAAAGHKGLHGPQGTGFLAFREGLPVRPLIFGGTGTASDSVYQPLDPEESQESGTLNTPAIAGLAEGIAWTMKNRAEIEARIRRLTLELIEGLKAVKNAEIYTADGDLNGVVAFNLKNMSSSAAGDILNERYDVAVRCGRLGTLKNGAIRASVGWNNALGDVRKFLSAVGDLSEI